MKDSDIYFDPVNNSDDSLVFQLDDHIKDFYCRYRDIRLSKDTLVNLGKIYQFFKLTFCHLQKSEKPLEHLNQIKELKLMTINFQRFKISHL